MVGLLWLASWVERWYAVAAVGVVFSYVLLTNYALLHEATHNNLHANPRVNYWLGLLTGLLFPVPFSLAEGEDDELIAAVVQEICTAILAAATGTENGRAAPQAIGKTAQAAE